MAGVISTMDIDNENANDDHAAGNLKGKDAIVGSSRNHSKATPWVEKYRPQSLSDVAAHRDIIETSMCFLCRDLNVSLYNTFV